MLELNKMSKNTLGTKIAAVLAPARKMRMAILKPYERVTPARGNDIVDKTSIDSRQK